MMDGIQLNRFIATSGVCSRRNAVELIKAGSVVVNNIRCYNPGYRVQPTDIVIFRKQQLSAAKATYILLNKPDGYITTRQDEAGRPTVFDLCTQFEKSGIRLFPVGRLDSDSEGLLLLTNDGALAEKLAHPRFGVTKIYRVKVHQPIEAEFLQQLRKGIYLKDGFVACDRVVVHPRNESCLTIELHSGKNRVIRRLLAHGGYHVTELRRIQYGPLKGRSLPRGLWRNLSGSEIAALKKLATDAVQ